MKTIEKNQKLTFNEYCKLRARKYRELDDLSGDDWKKYLHELKTWEKRIYKQWMRPAAMIGFLGLALFLLSYWVLPAWLRLIGVILGVSAAIQTAKFEYYLKGYSSGFDAGIGNSIELNGANDETVRKESSHGRITNLLRQIPHELRPLVIMFTLSYIAWQVVSETWLRIIILIGIAILTGIVNVTVGTDETSDIE